MREPAGHGTCEWFDKLDSEQGVVAAGGGIRPAMNRGLWGENQGTIVGWHGDGMVMVVMVVGDVVW